MTRRPLLAADLRAELFDSGGVLVQPIGGRWNPRADFEQTVLGYVPWVRPDQFAAAIAAGDRFMAASATTPDRDDYHRVLPRHLGVQPAPQLLADLRRPADPSVVLETFPDVAGTLHELRRRGVRMAVVCDSWPSLPDLHSGLGIGEFFAAYAISASLGCRKPDPACTTTPAPHAALPLRNASSSTMTKNWSPPRSRSAIRGGWSAATVSRLAETYRLSRRSKGC